MLCAKFPIPPKNAQRFKVVLLLFVLSLGLVSFLPLLAMAKPTTQGQYCNIKTVLPIQTVLDKLEKLYPEEFSAVAASHVTEDGASVNHCHIVVRFNGVRRWNQFYDWIHSQDGHEYIQPARSWRRSCRYVLHLDNPEKHEVSRDRLVSSHIDEDELAQLLGAKRQPILESLIAAQSLPLNRRFEFLVVKRGHSPAEVSAALRCMLDLEKFQDKRFGRTESALPQAVVDSELSTPDELEEMGLFHDEDFYE